MKFTGLNKKVIDDLIVQESKYRFDKTLLWLKKSRSAWKEKAKRAKEEIKDKNREIARLKKRLGEER